MKRGTKFTPKIARDITSDWQRAIPSLGIYRPLRLLRRVGPLLLGVCLERDSSGEIYRPTFHTHFLGSESTSISLSMCMQLRSPRSGGPTFLPLHLHAEKHAEFAALMESQALLPLDGDLSLVQINTAYINYISQPGGWHRAVFLMRDASLLSAWARQPDIAEDLLRDCLRIENYILFSPWGTRSNVEQICRRMLDAPSDIEAKVAAEIVKHDLVKLPVSEIVTQ